MRTNNWIGQTKSCSGCKVTIFRYIFSPIGHLHDDVTILQLYQDAFRVPRKEKLSLFGAQDHLPQGFISDSEPL